MPYLWLFLLLLGTNTLSAQTDYPQSGFGLEVYPHLGNNRLLRGAFISFREARRIDSLETAAFGYGIGGFYGVRGEKIGYHFGIRYMVTGYERDRGPLDFDPTQPGDFPDYVETFTARFVEVPFYWNFYQNLGDKTSFFFTLGMAASFNLSNETERTVFRGQSAITETFEPNTEYRRVNFALLSAIGITYQLSDRIVLGLQPNFEYTLQPNALSSEDQLNRTLYNLGLRFTVQYLR